MNCRPGDLARIVGMPGPLREANDRIVRLKNQPPMIDEKGQPLWRLESRVDFVALGNAKSNGVAFWVGTPLTIDELQDKYLRPIRPQADDATDESTAWLPPVPVHELETL